MNGHADRSSGIPIPRSYLAPESTVSERKLGDVSIVEVEGPLIAQRAAQDLRNRVRELLDRGARKIAVDLSGVGEIDSYGLGGLAAAYNWTAAAGGTIELFAPQPRVQRMLKRLRLDSVLGVFHDQEGAVRALQSAVAQHPAGDYTVSWRWM